MMRVGITGMGAISAAGPDVGSLWSAALEGRSGVGALDIPRMDRLRIRVGAQVRDFQPADFLSDEELRRCDRYTQFAHVAVEQAIRQSGLAPEELAGPRTAAIIGTGIGGMTTVDDGCYDFYAGGGRLPVMGVPRLIPSSATSHVSITHGITGPCFAVTSACASASQAIGLALQMIRAGIVDRAVVGGSEACLTPATVKAWELMRVLSPDLSRPFSRDRTGIVLGEGAGVVVLESQAAIDARGGRALAWLAGYGTSSDARDMVQPDVNGASAAMAACLDDAGIAPEAVDYINAHGTGTVLNDVNEAAAIVKVFGDGAATIPVTSSKPIFGHVLGGSGALELMVTVEAMRNQIVPPQINMTAQDPNCPIFVPQDALQRPIRTALSNSFAFGGINACLLVTAA